MWKKNGQLEIEFVLKIKLLLPKQEHSHNEYMAYRKGEHNETHLNVWLFKW